MSWFVSVWLKSDVEYHAAHSRVSQAGDLDCFRWAGVLVLAMMDNFSWLQGGKDQASFRISRHGVGWTGIALGLV